MESDARTSERETSLSSPPPTDSDIDVNIGLDIDSDVNSDSETATAQSNTASESQTNNEQKIEWLATTRERRSTAGNRMKSMLANEEPDSDLELLFAEDEDDEGFSEVDDGGLDVHMDSSDDEDENDDDDNLEGEKELEKQARERTAAQRKRKAQEAIPAKFRKKVRIDPITKPPAASTTPAPRPRKKSERTSWLPSVADLPTRASSRQTTRTSKEQLHQQMVEREARRLKQLAQMQKKAERLEASRKPPMTQEERLREAALVEKRNSKSLNRWEVAEKHREEERRAKLAALNNRTLKGPVMTFWSGIGELIGRRLVVEEPVKEKRKRGDKSKDRDKGKEKDKKNTNGSVEDGLLKQEASQDGAPAASGAAKPEPNPEIPGQLLSQPQPPLAVPTEPTNLTQSSSTNTPNLVPAQIDPVSKSTCPAETVGEGLVETGSTAPAATTPADKSEETSRPLATSSPPTSSMLAPPANITLSTTTSVSSHSPLAPPASGLVAPAPRLNAHRPVMAMVAPQPGLARASESKPSGVLAAPVLAPPAGIGMNGVVPPVLGYGTSTSNILAPPNTSQTLMPPTMSSIPTVAPPSIPPPIAAPSPGPGSEPSKPKLAPGPATTLADAPSKGSMKDTLTEPASYHLVKTSQLNGADSVANNTHPPPPTPSTGARNAIIFQNFDENAIKDRGIQTQILFGRKMNKLAKPAPAPLCVITNHPARYRDPGTGLPYYNTYAYREIQRLCRSEYHWSRILGAWVGSGTFAARGVPARFLHPEKEHPDAEKNTASGDESKEVQMKDVPEPKTAGTPGPTKTPPSSQPATAKDEPTATSSHITSEDSTSKVVDTSVIPFAVAGPSSIPSAPTAQSQSPPRPQGEPQQNPSVATLGNSVSTAVQPTAQVE